MKGTNMNYKTEFMELYEELSLLNEAKPKRPNIQTDTQSAATKELEQILKSNQLITIADAFGVANATSSTGWTFLVPANRISDFRKQTVDFDALIKNKLANIALNVSIAGWPSYAKEPIKGNGGRSIIELDLGTYKNRNQWRGLGFTVSYKEHKYFIIGHLFTKKRQKINADDLEVKTANRLYDTVVPAFKNLSKK
jgi:phage-related protein